MKSENKQAFGTLKMANKKGALWVTRFDQVRLITDLGHSRKTEEWEEEGAGTMERKDIGEFLWGGEAGERGGAEGGVTRLTERERWGPVANLLREYDLIYGGHYSEGQTNGGY